MQERFFKDSRFPFAECRYSRSSVRQFKPHLHQTFSVGAVDAGEVEYVVAGQKAILIPGGLALINPEILHSCNATTDAGRSYYMLHLDKEWCCKVQRSMWEVEEFVLVGVMHLESGELYQRYIALMEMLMGAEHHLLEKEECLVEFVAELFCRTCGPRSKRVEERSSGIEKLKQLLTSDLKNELTLTSLADYLKVNPYTLIRRFKAETGATPHAYRMNYRVELARKLLQQGMDIAETALECGFFDQSHFHRHFKAMTTVTPKEYRVNFVQ